MGGKKEYLVWLVGVVLAFGGISADEATMLTQSLRRSRIIVAEAMGFAFNRR